MRRPTTVVDSAMALTLERTLTRDSNGEHGSSDSGPGPELFLHRACSEPPAAYPLGFGFSVRKEGCAPLFSCCDSGCAQVGS